MSWFNGLPKVSHRGSTISSSRPRTHPQYSGYHGLKKMRTGRKLREGRRVISKATIRGYLTSKTSRGSLIPMVCASIPLPHHNRCQFWTQWLSLRYFMRVLWGLKRGLHPTAELILFDYTKEEIRTRVHLNSQMTDR